MKRRMKKEKVNAAVNNEWIYASDFIGIFRDEKVKKCDSININVYIGGDGPFPISSNDVIVTINDYEIVAHDRYADEGRCYFVLGDAWTDFPIGMFTEKELAYIANVLRWQLFGGVKHSKLKYN